MIPAGRRRTWKAIATAAVAAAACGAQADATHIYGIHSWAVGASNLLNGRTGWCVEVVNTDPWPHDPSPEQIASIAAEGFTPIVRINKFFGQTVPSDPSEYDAFAAACAGKVAMYGGACRRWIIGNEMNADFEGGIPAAAYATVYRRCRAAIHAAQPGAEVLVGAVAPWNATLGGAGPYPPNQPWLNYMYALVHDLEDEADGFAIHAYGGRDGDDDPRDDDGWGFGVFRDWMNIIDSEAHARHKPVYLTEMNHAADGQGPIPGYPAHPYPDGYIQRLYEAVDEWNRRRTHDILCAAWFSHANPGFPGYNISTNPTMGDDFGETTRTTDYRFDRLWETRGTFSLD